LIKEKRGRRDYTRTHFSLLREKAVFVKLNTSDEEYIRML
jgi:hypothetical protein